MSHDDEGHPRAPGVPSATGEGGLPRWRRARGALWRRVLDDVVVSVAGGSEPFALAGGLGLWVLLETPRTMSELVAALRGDCGGGTGAIEEDLRALLDDLAAHGAVEISR